jgi:hypothetical protein
MSGSGRRRVDLGFDTVFPGNLTEVVQQGVRRMERSQTKLWGRSSRRTDLGS